MDLFNYVALLLQTQQSVGVEGLGTFYNEYIPGVFDEEQEVFLPPKIQTAFQTEISETEALKTLLSEKKNMNEGEVNEWIASVVKKTYSDIEEFGKSNLYPLGTLQKREQTLTLEQLEGEHQANHTYFGLPVIDAEDSPFNFLNEEPVASKTEEEIIPTFNNEHIEPTTTVAHVEELFHDRHAEVEEERLMNTTEEYTPTWRRNFTGWWKWVVTIVILALLSFVIYVLSNRPEWSKKWLPPTEKLKDSNLLLNDTKSTDSIVKTADNMWADSNLVDSSRKDSSALKLKNQANKYIETPPAIVDTFQVIVASYPNRTVAVQQLKLLIKNGLPAEIAHGAKGVRTKIAVGTFTSLDSAEQQQTIMQKKGFKEAWILIKKAN